MKTIESFRNNDYYRFAFLVATNPPTVIDSTYNAFITNAYHTTLADLIILENSKGHIHNGRTSYSSIVTWHLAIKSFLNDILQVALIFSNSISQAGQSIKSKMEEVIMLLKLDSPPGTLELLYDRLDDLDAIYNGIVEGRKEGEYVIKVALFSVNPKSVNQVDSVQAMLIACQVFELFRDAIIGWDIMPLVDFDTNGIRRAEKLDVLVKKIIIPATFDILSKLHLTTALNLIEEFQSLPPSPMINKDYVKLIQKVMEDPIYKIAGNFSDSGIIKNLQRSYSLKFD